MKTLEEYRSYMIAHGYESCQVLEYKEDREYQSIFSGGISVISSGDDLEESVVTQIHIPGIIKSWPNLDRFSSGYEYEDGIVLVEGSKTHGLELFEECLGLSGGSGFLLHEAKISRAHSENIEWILENVDPVLESFDFKVTNSSLLGNNDEGTTIEYTHPWGRVIYLRTDPLTGTLRCDQLESYDLKKDMSSLMDFRNMIIREFLYDPKTCEVRPEYEYLFDPDPKNNINTYQELVNMMSDLSFGKTTGCYDLNNIPDKYMGIYEEVCNKK